MGHTLLIAVFAASLASTAHAAESPVTVARIEADLAARGGDYVITRYFGCGPELGPGYRLVEAGDPSGVRLGVMMLKYSDACVTESLQDALGSAMARNPTVVLPYVNTSELLRAEEICLPFISEDDPPAKAEAIVMRTRRALERVHSKELAVQKAACLAQVAPDDRVLSSGGKGTGTYGR